MSIDILMPALSPTMEEGSLAKWHVKVGDNVRSGDVIAEIETDKATMEVEAVEEGVVEALLVPEGTENVKVNAPIARLSGEGAPASSPPSAAPPPAPPSGGRAEEPTAPVPPPSGEGDHPKDGGGGQSSDYPVEPYPNVSATASVAGSPGAGPKRLGPRWPGIRPRAIVATNCRIAARPAASSTCQPAPKARPSIKATWAA